MSYPFQAFTLTPAQEAAREVMAGKSRHILLAGGSRSGKTFLIVRALIIRALRADGTKHLITRLHSNALISSIWLDTFPKVMTLCFPDLPHTKHRRDGYISFPNGSELWFGGLDEGSRTEKILGQEYSSFFANEASQIPYSSILIVRTRLAARHPKLRLRGFYDLNPTSTQHWTYLEFLQGMNPLEPRKEVRRPEQFAHFFINPEDNIDNLSEEYLDELRGLPTAYRMRFYEGQYQTAIAGALWTLDTFDAQREDEEKPPMRGGDLGRYQRIVVAVDPSGAQNKEDVRSDEIGIIVVGLRHDGTAAVLEDATMLGSPDDWGTAVIAAYRRWHADLIVAEKNFGGAMVESTIRAANREAPVRLVNASRGKMVRAEPVSLLYSQKRVVHCGDFAELEDQLCNFSIYGYQGDRSPDRADALVWALTELLVDQTSTYTLAHIR